LAVKTNQNRPMRGPLGDKQLRALSLRGGMHKANVWRAGELQGIRVARRHPLFHQPTMVPATRFPGLPRSCFFGGFRELLEPEPPGRPPDHGQSPAKTLRQRRPATGDAGRPSFPCRRRSDSPGIRSSDDLMRQEQELSGPPFLPCEMPESARICPAKRMDRHQEAPENTRGYRLFSP